MGSLEEEIRAVEGIIVTKKRMGKDASFEKGLVREWKRYLPGGDKHDLWVKHSYSTQR